MRVTEFVSVNDATTELFFLVNETFNLITPKLLTGFYRKK